MTSFNCPTAFPYIFNNNSAFFCCSQNKINNWVCQATPCCLFYYKSGGCGNIPSCAIKKNYNISLRVPPSSKPQPENNSQIVIIISIIILTIIFIIIIFLLFFNYNFRRLCCGALHSSLVRFLSCPYQRPTP